MQKVYNLKTKIIFCLFLLFLAFFSCPKKIFAAEENREITLVSRIKNVYNTVSNVYTYKLEAEDELTRSVFEEPLYYEVKFDNIMPNSNNIATVSYDIDFSEANFEKLGYYKFIVSEVDSSDKEAFPISSEKYEIIVVVTCDENNQLIIKPVEQVMDINSNEKTDLEFEHETVMTYINIEEYTHGKLAEQDRNVYFKYKLTILGNVGNKYRILGQDKQVSFDGSTIITDDYYEIKEGQENYIYVYLKHGQRITVGISDDDVNQIPIGTRYSLQKIGARKWNTTINDQLIKATDFLVAGVTPEQNLIVIVNERDFEVALTGIFINILPFAILIVLAVVGIAFLLRYKKNDDEEDDD